LAKGVKRREFEARQSLKDAGIVKIIAELGDVSDARDIIHAKIIVEHSQKDKQPIVIPVTREWYGDVREEFRAMAEKYFEPAVVLSLEREIGVFHIEIIEEELKEQEQRAAELKHRSQHVKSKLQLEMGAQPEGVETERTVSALGDWEHPITVKQGLFAKRGSIITVIGQISAMGKVFSMIDKGLYECQHCHQPQWITLERPYSPSDVIPDPWDGGDRCRFCEKEWDKLTREEQRNARILRLRMTDDARAIKVELMDTEAYNEIDSLQVIFFSDEARNVRAGEHVIVRGKVYVLASTRRSGLFHPIIYAHKVKYVDRDTFELTDKEIKRAKKFAKLVGDDSKIIPRLVSIYAPHIIGNEQVKEALLYSEVSAGPDVIGKGSANKRRKRINVGLVSSPGLGKSTMLRAILAHDDRNKYAGAQSSTGRSITAIVSKEGDSQPVLRIGSLPHAKEAVIAINELGTMSLEEQKHLQDSMEEGQFPIDKHGIRANVRADAAVIWSSNPTQGANWSDDSRISLDEIPVRREIVDRTDLLIVLKAVTDPAKKREFNFKRLEMERASPARKKILDNYDQFIKIYLAYARGLKPTISEEAAVVLNDADIQIQGQREKHDLPNLGSNRALDTLMRLIVAIAKLKLKEEATVEDAQHAVKFYDYVASEVQDSINVPADPAMVSYHLMLYILQNESNGQPISFKDLVDKACERDPAVNWYLKGKGDKLKIRDNAAMKRVLGLLETLSHGKIKRTKMIPAEFMWIGGVGKEEDGGSSRGSDSDSSGSTEGEGEKSSKQSLQCDKGDVGDVDQDKALQQKLLFQEEQSPFHHKHDYNQTSPTSQTSHIEVIQNKRVEKSSEESKILKAMDLAMLDYNHDKIIGQESGCMFTAQGMWYHMAMMHPDEEWDLDRVRKVIQQQIKKGRVLTRQGDDPDIFYLIWRDGEQS
jgi:DNA replicative helicase MCM subunit Mcm2 (Cdc46/Mcm family)